MSDPSIELERVRKLERAAADHIRSVYHDPAFAFPENVRHLLRAIADQLDGSANITLGVAEGLNPAIGVGPALIPAEAQGASVKPEYPKPCGLCPGTIESKDDLDWHGLGNCVEICEACTGSGIEDKAALDRLIESRVSERTQELQEALVVMNEALHKAKLLPRPWMPGEPITFKVWKDACDSLDKGLDAARAILKKSDPTPSPRALESE